VAGNQLLIRGCCFTGDRYHDIGSGVVKIEDCLFAMFQCSMFEFRPFLPLDPGRTKRPVQTEPDEFERNTFTTPVKIILSTGASLGSAVILTGIHILVYRIRSQIGKVPHALQ
jgi:hypothetical protein